MKTDSHADGFTLVEVMVALAIVAIALPALMFSLHQQVDGTAYLRDKSLARMVATNKLNETRLLARARQQLEKGSDTGSYELAGREWQWQQVTTETAVPNFYQIEIEVSAPDAPKDEVLFTLIGSMSGDLANVGVGPAPGGPGAPGGSENQGETSGNPGGPSIPDLGGISGEVEGLGSLGES